MSRSPSPNHIAHESWRGYSVFDGTCRGIPCQIAFSATPPSLGYRDKYGQWEPDDPGGIDEIVIVDRRGYVAGWLQDQMTPEDEKDVERQINDWIEDQRSSYDDYDDEGW